jgi:chemotaxis protein MotA
VSERAAPVELPSDRDLEDSAPAREPLNLTVVLGTVIGLAAVVGGQLWEGGSVVALANGPAFIIVLGGTLGAIIVQTNGRDLLQALRMAAWLIHPPSSNPDEVTQKFVSFARVARREGLLSLETAIAHETDPFLRSGLQLLVDGTEPGSIRDAMDVDLHTREQRDLAGAKVYESMGGYCPTIGIIGAVLGLIHVMSNLADQSLLGDGIAAAFVATIYGVGFANLVFLPVGNRLKSMVAERCHWREMVIEGVTSIAQGENPRHIEVRLGSYVS